MARQAKVSATSSTEGCGPENVINGISVPPSQVQMFGNPKPLGENGEGITLSLNKKSDVREIRIYFDPNFTKEIMPSITKTVLDRQVEGMPSELVRDYKVECLDEETVVYTREVKDNTQRLNILDIPEVAVTVSG